VGWLVPEGVGDGVAVSCVSSCSLAAAGRGDAYPNVTRQTIVQIPVKIRIPEKNFEI